MEEQMESKHTLVEKHGMIPEESDGGSDRVLEFSPGSWTASEELECMEKLLLADWRGRWGKPLTADELLMVSNNAFETLFHKPPIGPIPEYLVAHWSVYGCVAEYEEKLEELDRWKALQLSRWLQDRIGRNWHVAGRVYQFQLEKEGSVGSEKFWFRLIEDRAANQPEN
jgi:hypothetical protein